MNEKVLFLNNMGKADKSYQELLEENALLKARLNDVEKDASIIKNTLNVERRLNLNFINALPYGIYRIRVFSERGTNEQQWHRTTNPPHLIEFSNKRFCEILSIEKNILEGNPGIIIDSVYIEDKADFAKKNVEANLNLTPFKWDGRLNIQGKISWVHFESLPYLMDNRDVIWTGILYDNDENKKTEEEIINKNSELKKLNSEKDRFLSIVAHDLKGPFNAIMGFSELMLENIQQNDTEKINKFAKIILNSSKNAITLLTNLMEWSQLQTDRIKFHQEDLNMSELIDDILLMFKDITKQKEIILSKDYPAQITIYADKNMLNSILRNLVSNAIKFTMPSGKITISAKIIKKELMVSVSDTGIGIPLNTMNKIFSLDGNISTSGTQNEKGTGLGLILCKEFVGQHNGKIWVESEPNKGSTFYFTIPDESKKSKF